MLDCSPRKVRTHAFPRRAWYGVYAFGIGPDRHVSKRVTHPTVRYPFSTRVIGNGFDDPGSGIRDLSHSWGWNLSSIYVSKAEMFKPGWVHNFQFHVAWQRVPYAACSQKWYLRPHKGQSCATCRDTIQRSRQEFTRFHSDAAMQRPAASMRHKASTCPNDALHGRW